MSVRQEGAFRKACGRFRARSGARNRAQLRQLCARRDSFAEPLDPDDEHEVIRRVDQERDESLVVRAEMQRSQQRGRVSWLAGVALILDRVDEHYCVHKSCQHRPDRRA